MAQITKDSGALRAHLARQLAPLQRAALDALGDAVAAAGGRALLLGGCVRDAALGRSLRDLDVEVFGVPPGHLRSLVQARFRADVVGRHFPVLRLHGLSIDVSLPRRRAPAGAGTPDFDADADPEVTPAEAAARRDFTLNAIGLDPRSGELVDPLGGLSDLAAGLLRHASERFDEDPVRVLRAMQLVARFELTVAGATKQRCRGLVPAGLPRERVFGEWRRLLLEGVRPSLGLAWLQEVGWLRHFPELEALVGCPQDPVWHPEGDVFVHTGHCLDAFARERRGETRDDLVVGLAVLCHDFGKPATTRSEAGRVTSKSHEALGASLCEAFLARLCDERDLVAEVACLVAAHLAPSQLHRDGAGDAAIRRLARRVGRIDRLVRVAAADHAGRPPLAEPFAAGEWLLARARALEVVTAAPRPLVQGRHLLAEGRAPGPAFGPILRACYEAQLAGAFASESEGVAFLRRLLEEKSVA
jgi:tRNA nucleotidyltransferase (CCA-adding enzyme)